MAFPKALKERKVAMLHGQAQTEAISTVTSYLNIVRRAYLLLYPEYFGCIVSL